jgi:hypothetical protein
MIATGGGTGRIAKRKGSLKFNRDLGSLPSSLISKTKILSLSD